ncbi:unnamed protein product [Cylindrotheca closterium]|uniref:t-SNARE coiled-coil homology domain-containing protein n=1 Tax=Cylindrotheca closterium TaxID=2856 RepID=A0AAD2PWS4_9STRA|nr:unnamed protein product [Cylindrotheca closterium]
MSFQDIGRRNAGQFVAPKTGFNKGQHQAGKQPLVSGNRSVIPGSVAQISESLSQFQRNVGILEKIAQQFLFTSTNRSSRAELEQQYDAQMDVLKQLERRLKEQILNLRRAATAGDKQALVKLERDFERVQITAESCKSKVSRQQMQFEQKKGSGLRVFENNSAAVTLQENHDRYQMQVQEDCLREEIMREREEEIKNINEGMHTVNEIYKDLSHIVGDQQEQIDQIEGQMEDARTNAESGLTQVQKANEKYNNSNCSIS